MSWYITIQFPTKRLDHAALKDFSKICKWFINNGNYEFSTRKTPFFEKSFATKSKSENLRQKFKNLFFPGGNEGKICLFLKMTVHNFKEINFFFILNHIILYIIEKLISIFFLFLLAVRQSKKKNSILMGLILNVMKMIISFYANAFTLLILLKDMNKQITIQKSKEKINESEIFFHIHIIFLVLYPLI